MDIDEIYYIVSLLNNEEDPRFLTNHKLIWHLEEQKPHKFCSCQESLLKTDHRQEDGAAGLWKDWTEHWLRPQMTHRREEN